MPAPRSWPSAEFRVHEYHRKELVASPLSMAAVAGRRALGASCSVWLRPNFHTCGSCQPASSCPCHYFVACELPSGEDLWCRTTRIDRGRADRCGKLLDTLVAHQACTFDALQDRLKGLVQLAAGTTFQDFQQQLAQRVGLPAAQLQVVIACSRANEFDQLQKIPIHEGTVSFRGIKCRPPKRNAASWCLLASPSAQYASRNLAFAPLQWRCKLLCVT